MPRLSRPPLTLADVWQDGPPLRVRDLVALTSLSEDTVYRDIASGDLITAKRGKTKTSPHMIERHNARAWLRQMGFGSAPSTSLVPATTGFQPHSSPTVYRNDLELLILALQHMGLGSIVRNAIGTAKTTLGGSDGVLASVRHQAWTSQDVHAKPTYASAVTRSAFVEFKSQLVRSNNTRTGVAPGQEVVSRASVLFLEPFAANGAANRIEPIDPRDKIVLPDGSTGPILAVNGPVDPDTDAPFFLQVYLG